MTNEMTTTKWTWTTNQGTVQSLTNFWIMLNLLNQQTNSYPNTYLEPSRHLYPSNNMIKYSRKILTDSTIQKIKNEKVNCLTNFLSELYLFGKKHNVDFFDQYWYEQVPDANRQNIHDEKFQLFKKYHDNAPIS